MDNLLIVFTSSGLFLALISLPRIMGREISANSSYGFCTSATLSDPEQWYPVNRCAGWWFFSQRVGECGGGDGFRYLCSLQKG
jgi:hypothetical protein